MVKICNNCNIEFKEKNNFCDQYGLKLTEKVVAVNIDNRVIPTEKTKFKDADKLVLWAIIIFNIVLFIGTLTSFTGMDSIVLSLYTKTIFDALVIAINFTLVRLLLCILSFVLLVNNNLRWHTGWKISYYFIIANICLIILQFMFILFQF